MSFQQGLSGLNASSKQLDTIGNNVANAGTVGFKQSQAQFADTFAASLSGAGAGAVQIGTGTKVAAIAQQFTQGNITNTNNTMDMAISGQGFFRLIDQNGAILYSRNGQFQVDKNGFIVNNQGHKVSGYLPDASGVISAAQPAPLQIPSADLVPKQTSDLATGGVPIGVGLNLNALATVPLTAVFSSIDPSSYNNSTSLTVYDSLGVNHLASLYFQKTVANDWNAYLTIDGAPTAGTLLTNLTFDTLGQVTVPVGTVSTVFSPVGAAVQTLVFDFSKASQYGANFGVNSLTQDGYTSGRLNGVSTSSDGTILGRYTNGQSRAMGQLLLANFANPQGLQPVGNNEWVETFPSGSALFGVPGSASLGVLQSSAVEDSNVDLTAELVNMITAQRVYQANAQTIKAQDQILQTLVNLR
jgi:flagellar hook protein FlgE